MDKNNQPLLNTDFLPLKLFNRGKVRDIYEFNGALLIIASDRVSAFDVVLPNGIPYKGKVLTGISEFWFKYVSDIVENHFITTEIEETGNPLILQHMDILKGRSMLVKKTKVIPIECVIRGYLAGSGWKEYQLSRSICGIPLPRGLKESDKLPEPIFTPAKKSFTGHDENIPFSEVVYTVGQKLAEELKEKSMEIYLKASDYARNKGIIICDTKFEWGVADNGKVILIDEVLTPDSSRFWPLDGYTPGRPQPSYDKQIIRDYLESIKWNKLPPAPPLPPDIVRKTSERYLAIYRTITGKDLF